MKATFIFEDVEDGTVNTDITFDPALTKENDDTPVALIAASVIDLLTKHMGGTVK